MNYTDKLSEISLFNKHKSTLSKTSRDNANDESMIGSAYPCIDFDVVRNEYVTSLNESTGIESNDAIIIKDNIPYFVEFKNGFIDKKEKFAIIRKIYDSLIIFSDLSSLSMNEIKGFLGYILVYNHEKNTGNTDRDLELKNTRYNSESYYKIAKKIGALSRHEFKCFGLSVFEKYCFSEIHTYTIQEFEDFISIP